MKTRYLSLTAFLSIVIGGGLLIGFLTAPDEWYAGLDKPSFTPPGWVFGPVWTIIYAMIAIAGWRAWCSNPLGTLTAIWFIQMALNFAWSPVFFSAHLPIVALLILAAMLVMILSFIIIGWLEDRVAAWLFVPYAAWVAFAAALNIAIISLN